ncbi:MAG: septal ring lytic transglycosylase RlpA family protein [Actinomycetota bacterium]
MKLERVLRGVLAVGLISLGVGAAAPGVQAADIETLRARAQVLAGEVTGLESNLLELDQREKKLERQIDRTTRDIAAIDLKLDAADQSFDTARATYISRAVEAYKTDPSFRLALILASESLTEIESAVEITSRMARNDSSAVKDFATALSATEVAQQQADDRKQRLMTEQQELNEVSTEISSNLLQRRRALRSLTAEIEKLEKRARETAAATVATPAEGPGGPGGPLLNTDQAFLKLLAPAGPAKGIPPEFVGSGVAFEGVASWYGPGFEGNLTASGDVYDSRLYTVASKELPLGTWLYVEHQGRGVVVLVNDRGPYVGDRILDLSRAAAQAIGIGGLGWVKAEILFRV